MCNISDHARPTSEAATAIGEAMATITMPPFLADLKAGRAKKVYRDEARANVQTSPTPRFDLLKFDRYLHIGVQWCRGCPFNCDPEAPWTWNQ